MGPLLFYPTSESDVSNKAVNVGQIIGKMGEAKIWLYTKYLLKKYATTRITGQAGPQPWGGTRNQQDAIPVALVFLLISGDLSFVPE
jgi:hypothetical protein